MPDFKTSAGSAAAEQMDQEARALRGGRGRYRMEQLRIIKDFAGLLRPITPRAQWQTCKTHQFMPTKDKPEQWQGDNWPKFMWGICRRDNIFRLRDEQGNLTDEFEAGYGDCYLCSTYKGVKDEKFPSIDKGVPTALTYGVAVQREERRNGQGATIGLGDKMEEFKDSEGATHQIPAFVMIAQRWPNFWAGVSSTLYLDGALAEERDFSLTRKDNDYKVGLVNIDPVHKPGAASWDVYTNALKLVGFGDGDAVKGLQDYIVSHSTLDHYRTWFIPGEEPEGGYGRRKDDDTAEGEKASTTGAAATPAAPGLDPDALSGFREQLKGRGEQK
jgi:hypothetical protein